MTHAQTLKGKQGKKRTTPNPLLGTRIPAERRERISQTLRGRPRIADIDRISRHQIALMHALAWAPECLEWRIYDGTSLWYVDLADGPNRLAIEVDGASHRLIRQQKVDRYKERQLHALGWTVLRFSNRMIDESLAEVTATIRDWYTTSK